MNHLHHVWRRLRARPGSAFLTVALLALGIALTTAAFTVLDALIIRPLPFPRADRLIQLDDALTTNGVAPPVADWRRHPMFEAVERAEGTTGELEGPNGVESLGVGRVTPGLFDMLEAQPLLGRVFEQGEGRAGADDRLMLSEAVWRSIFAADPRLIGRRVVLDEREMLVVGIMPAEFRFPATDTLAWIPIGDDAPYPVGLCCGMVYARVVDNRELPPRLEDELGGKLVMATPVLGSYEDFTRRAFWGLVGGAFLILLILSASVASLHLAQLARRRRDLGVSIALGASPGRLIREILIEQTLLGVIATIAGLAVAEALVGFAAGQVSSGRSLNPMNIDGRALAVASALGISIVALCGLLPAWMAIWSGTHRVLIGATRGSTDTRRVRIATRGLLVGQIAVAFALLTASTLLVRSFIEMVQVSRGIDVEGVIAVPFSLSRIDAQSRALIARAVEERVEALAGVEDALVSGRLPVMLSRYATAGPLTPDRPGAEPIEVEAEAIQASGDFFSFFRIPILQGRALAPMDTGTEVVLGERLASILWPDDDPIGRTFRAGEVSHLVVGLAHELTVASLDRDRDRPEYYVVEGRTTTNLMVSLRCAGACPSEAILAEEMLRVHPDIRLSRARLLEEEFDIELAEPRSIAEGALYFGAFAVTAVAGALFAVLSYSVRLRRRDYGIRAALGASPRHLRWSVARESVVLSGAGVVAGAGGAWVLSRWLSSLHYGVVPLDPVSWIAMVVLIGSTAILASWLPARDAERADPRELLRSE